MNTGRGWPIARIFGFEIRLHLSWVPILAFLTLSVLAELQTLDPSAPSVESWAIAVLVSAGFLASVLVHELAHALVARRRGIAGGPITLFFFGGTASVELEASRPDDEIRIAAAGPIASLLLAAVLVVLAAATDATDSEPVAIVGSAALILGALNGIVGLINLVPGFPLDGGRVLRAIVWGRTNDERTGTRAAAVGGRLAGWGLTLIGIVVAVAGDGVDGVMLMISGWFLASAAGAMDRRVLVEDLLRGARVEEAVERDVPRIAPQLTLDTFADQFTSGPATSIAVFRGDDLLGILGLSQLRRVGRRSWPKTRAEDLMVAVDDLPSLRADDALWPAIETLRRSGLDGLPVLGDEGLLGLLTRRSAMAAIARRARGEAVGIL
ncbi:MAG TPA: site-2 protease family protein [Candidatus Limnocylindrales bacterium]|nr:site-2 protease family protein [Candidatus Limnocylindrales bacterium]